MQKLPYLVIAAFILLLLTLGCTQNGSKEKLEYAYYHSDSEKTYKDIKLEGSLLTLTYFEDTNGKCESWVMQSACWNQTNLQAKIANLSDSEIQNLAQEIKKSGFFDLNQPAPTEGRYYAHTLEVKMNGVTKKYIYESYPGGPSKPEAFTKIENALSTLTFMKFLK